MPAATRPWSSSRSAAWLGLHATDPEASHVYKAWLDAGGDKALVEQPIRSWLGLHKTDPEARFVYKAWLDAGGDKALVEQPIRSWLGLHATDPEASHVYKAWLDAGGDKALVEQPIRSWLGLHKTDPEASHVYKAWLDAGGDKALVEQPIRDWLGLHKTDPEAQFAYNAWLDAGGDKALVEQPIRDWLECHAESEVADFVMRSWLRAQGDPALVIESACRWMAINWHRQEAVYLTKELSKLDNLPITAIKNILRWCCHFPEDEDALWRLTRLFHHLGPPDLDMPFVATAAVLLNTRLATGREASVELALHLRILFLNIGGIGLASKTLRSACDKLQLLIFRDKRAFPVATNDPSPQNRFMIDLVLTLIQVGRLNFRDSTDRAAFRRFAGWLTTWDEANKEWVRLVLEQDSSAVVDPDLRQELLEAVQPGTPDALRPVTAAE